MKAFFQDTLKYTKNCNLQLIDLLLKNPEAYVGTVSLLMSHTLNAHHVWNSRVIGETPKYSVWQNLDLIDLKAINDRNFENSIKILTEKDLNKIINYENSKGERFTNTIEEIFFHLFAIFIVILRS